MHQKLKFYISASTLKILCYAKVSCFISHLKNHSLHYSTNHSTMLNYNFRFHGKGGPMPVELPKFRSPSAHLFVEACKQNGFKFNRDYNGANQFGVTFQHQNSKAGSRFSTARAYLKPVHQRRPNLTILLGSL